MTDATQPPYVDASLPVCPDNQGYGDTTQASEEAPGTAQHLVQVRTGHPGAPGEEPSRAGDVRSGDQAAARGDVAPLRGWLEAEFARAQRAARTARIANEDARRREGPKAVRCFHTSAVARMCALGEVLQRLDGEAPC